MFKRGRVGVLLALVVGLAGAVNVGAAAGGSSLRGDGSARVGFSG